MSRNWDLLRQELTEKIKSAPNAGQLEQLRVELLGKKGSVGFYWIVERPDGELRIPFIANRGSMAEVTYAKNPLLNPKRRRGNANVVWDLPPMEKRMLKPLEGMLNAILGKTEE